MHIRGDKHTSPDAMLHVWNLQLRQFARPGVHPHDVLVEGRYQHCTVVQFQQRGDEGVIHVERLLHLGFIATRMEADDIGGARCCPHRTVVCLLEVHRHGRWPLPQNVQPRPVILTFHHDVAC